MSGYSDAVHPLLRRPRLLIGALLFAAVAVAVVAAIATHNASPLQPVFGLGDSPVRSYVATKSQWEAANTAHTVAWVTATLSVTLLLATLAIGVMTRPKMRPRNGA